MQPAAAAPPPSAGVNREGIIQLRFCVGIRNNLFFFFSSPFGQQKRFRAVYDYAAADDDEVSFMDGDVIVDVQQIDEGWMYGRVERTGQQGMLPANYVEII